MGIQLTYGGRSFVYKDPEVNVDDVTRTIQYVRSGRGDERGFLTVVHKSGTTLIDITANVPIFIEEISDIPATPPIQF